MPPEQKVVGSNPTGRTNLMIAEKFTAWIWAVVIWVGVIFFSSTSLASKWAEGSFGFLSRELFSQMRLHSSSYDIVHLLADKGFHVSLFCVLAVLLWQALPRDGNKIWTILLIGAVVGSCSEFLQSFFPDRDPAVRDVLINVGGTAVGLAICTAVSKLQAQRSTVPTEV